jgi:hypothetical protein
VGSSQARLQRATNSALTVNVIFVSHNGLEFRRGSTNGADLDRKKRLIPGNHIEGKRSRPSPSPKPTPGSGFARNAFTLLVSIPTLLCGQ